MESERLTQETNKNRIEFLRTELQTSNTLADMAESELTLDNPEHAARSLAEAEIAYATLVRFLTDPKHAGHIVDEERVEFAAAVQRLRARLDTIGKK